MTIRAPRRNWRRGRIAKTGAVTAVLCVLFGGVSACGNSEAEVNKRPHAGTGTATMVGGIQQVTIVTGNDLRFHPSTITAHQGTLRIVLENRTPPSGGPPHNLQVTGLPGAFVPLVQDGGAGSVTFRTPAPGRYRFVCTIHIAQGQTGVLIIEPGRVGG